MEEQNKTDDQFIKTRSVTVENNNVNFWGNYGTRNYYTLWPYDVVTRTEYCRKPMILSHKTREGVVDIAEIQLNKLKQTDTGKSSKREYGFKINLFFNNVIQNEFRRWIEDQLQASTMNKFPILILRPKIILEGTFSHILKQNILLEYSSRIQGHPLDPEIEMTIVSFD
jgi:hypothetical protein